MFTWRLWRLPQGCAVRHPFPGAPLHLWAPPLGQQAPPPLVQLRKTDKSVTHTSHSTPPHSLPCLWSSAVLGWQVKSHDWGRPSVALWGVIQLPQHRAVKRYWWIRSLLSALTGMLNVFWEELIGTKLVMGSFRADPIPQPTLAFWTIVSKRRKRDTWLMQLSQVRVEHYFPLQTSPSPKTRL